MTKPRNDSWLTQEILRSLITYDPETGTLARLPSGRAAGAVNDNGYVLISIRKKQYRAHRLAWLYMTGSWPVADLDHINGIRTDNRIANLREATRSQNLFNKKMDRRNKSGFRGVSWTTKKKLWGAHIKKDRKTRFIGYFRSPEAAYAAYCKQASVLFEEFAKTP